MTLHPKLDEMALPFCLSNWNLYLMVGMPNATTAATTYAITSSTLCLCFCSSSQTYATICCAGEYFCEIVQRSNCPSTTRESLPKISNEVVCSAWMANGTAFTLKFKYCSINAFVGYVT